MRKNFCYMWPLHNMQSEPFIAIICRQDPSHRFAMMFLVDYETHVHERAMTASHHEISFARKKLQRL